jgi:hypothetical protein
MPEVNPINPIQTKTILVPTNNQSQIAPAACSVYGGETVRQQCQLSVSSPSPCTLTFASQVTRNSTIHVVIQLSGDTVQSVIDDASNSYNPLAAFTNPDGTRTEVWSSPNVQTAPTGCIVTTNSTPIISAMVSELNGATVTK